MSLLEKLVANPKYASLRFVWLDGIKHAGFKSSFFTADGCPQLIAYQKKSMRVRYFKSGFEEGLLTEFADTVLTGKGRTAALDADPQFPKDTKKEL